MIIDVYEVEAEKKGILRKICTIDCQYELLDAVVRAYSDGNYDFYDPELGIHECYRDNGERFYLQTVVKHL